ncbi:hypothetical protein [Microbacterium sp. P5_E9]
MSAPSTESARKTLPVPDDATRADGPEIHLPNPPQGDPVRSSGRSQQDAEQHAIRDVSTHAVDAEAVAAGLGPLGFDFLRDAEGIVESVGALQDTEEAKAAGDVLIELARQGQGITPRKDVVAATQSGVEEQLGIALTECEDSVTDHRTTLDVLSGTATRSDGRRYPGRPIAPGAAHIGWAIVWARFIELLPFLVPLAIESIVVYSNMRAYLRTDDADVFSPAAIAASTVAVITMLPFLIGRGLNVAAHGGTLARWQRIGMAVGAGFWVAAAVLLATIRVTIDRAAAVAKAEDAARGSFQGDAAPSVAVDPNTVFEPVVPFLFWVVVFLGLGCMLVLWELLMHNPARVEELEARRDRRACEERVIRLTSLKAAIDGTVALREGALEHSLAMWGSELGAIDARSGRDKQVYRAALRNASGDPRMTLALEMRDESIASAAGGDAA